MQTIKHGKVIKEARVGNFNTALRSKVLKFLKDAGREDIEIQKLSNVAVNWTVDAGKTELNFEFTCDSDSYEINVKDGKGEKVETWAPQESVAELTDDLNDTLSFIDEFKNSLNTKVSPAKEEAVEESEEDDDEADKNEELNESEDGEKESFELLNQEDKDFIQGLVDDLTLEDFGSEIEEYAYECLDLEEVEKANFDAWKDQLYDYADSIDTYGDEDDEDEFGDDLNSSSDDSDDSDNSDDGDKDKYRHLEWDDINEIYNSVLESAVNDYPYDPADIDRESIHDDFVTHLDKWNRMPNAKKDRYESAEAYFRNNIDPDKYVDNAKLDHLLKFGSPWPADMYNADDEDDGDDD